MKRLKVWKAPADSIRMTYKLIPLRPTRLQQISLQAQRKFGLKSYFVRKKILNSNAITFMLKTGDWVPPPVSQIPFAVAYTEGYVYINTVKIKVGGVFAELTKPLEEIEYNITFYSLNGDGFRYYLILTLAEILSLVESGAWLLSGWDPLTTAPTTGTAGNI